MTRQPLAFQKCDKGDIALVELRRSFTLLYGASKSETYYRFGRVTRSEDGRATRMRIDGVTIVPLASVYVTKRLNAGVLEAAAGQEFTTVDAALNFARPFVVPRAKVAP